MIRAARLAIVGLLALAGAAGCGGGGSGSGGPDPASAVPANASVYFEGSVRPEGEVKEDALAAAGKLLGTSTPETTMREFFDKHAKDNQGRPVSWERDLAPWVGQRAGGWVAAGSGQQDRFALAIATTDKDKAQQFVDRDAGNARTASYKGVDYKVGNDDKLARGVSGDFVLLGTEPEFKRSIDAQKGDSLAENKRFKDATDKLEKNRLGTFYVDVKSLIAAGLRANPDGRQELDQVRRIFPIDRLGPITGAFTANGARLKFDSSIVGQGAEALGRLGLLTGAGSTKLLAELPGESWAAYGAPNVGRTAASLFDRFAGAIGGAAVANQVRQRTGLDLQRDVFDLMDDVAIFARGSTMSDLDGALIISVTDDARAADVFGKLVGLLRTEGNVHPRAVRVAGAEQAFRVALPNASKPLVLARGAGKLVVAYGEDAASAALEPKTRLGDSDLYRQAKASLDGKFDPAFLLSMPGILKLVDGLGSGSDPDFQQARPYLERLSVIASGGKGSKNGYDAAVGVGLR